MYHSKNASRADNQQERLFSHRQQQRFDDRFCYWLAGFVDGEGSFCLSLKKQPTTKFGWQIDPSFYLYQHERSLWILETVQQFFGAGCIHRKTSPYSVYTYALHGISHATNRVIPFFNQYNLLVKAETFSLFSQAVVLMQQRRHHTYEGFKEILHMAYQLNQIGKGRKWSIEETLESIPRD